jgi:phosphate transport system protein
VSAIDDGGGHVRAGFHADLERVTDILVEMADGVTEAIQTASRCLLTVDGDLARQVIAGDEAVNVRYRAVEEQISELLARQSPVAGDLRLVVAALHAAGDLERMGDLAVHVATTAQRRAPESALVPEVRDIITGMAECAGRIGEKVSTVLRTTDATVAAELESDDDAIDDMQRRLFVVLLDRSWPHGVAPAIDAAQLGRWYERFADHAVNAGRRVIYFVTGA